MLKPLQKDFVVIRVSKKRWRVAVVWLDERGEVYKVDFVSGKHKTKEGAEEACANWNEGTYGVQYGEWR